jgi:hypothetical protein
MSLLLSKQSAAVKSFVILLLRRIASVPAQDRKKMIKGALKSAFTKPRFKRGRCQPTLA